MTARQTLHQLVDTLPERDLPTASRVLEALSVGGGAEPIPDDKADRHWDGGLSETRLEALEGRLEALQGLLEAAAITDIGSAELAETQLAIFPELRDIPEWQGEDP